MSKGRVMVAMSGGVDSSVAALLLKEAGYDVVGITMRLWTPEVGDMPGLSAGCCSVEDVDDARRVCQILGVPHYFLNFEREFKKHVVDYFVAEYARGRTPHPCLACNDKVKFRHLLRRATSLGADYLATGHHARIRGNGGLSSLLRGVDQTKDQSYVLFTLTQRELARLLLPIGEHSKHRIREVASRAGLPVADKPDSQEICFIPDGDYRRFLGGRSEPGPGEFVDAGGTVLGEHTGIQFFTIGQRRGLGLNGNTGRPMYVTRIDPKTNRVVLGPEEELCAHALWASHVNFTSGQAPEVPVEVTAQIRYNAPEARAILVAHGDRAQVRFSQPQRAVAPGQAVVFYRGDEVLGGGIIEPDAPM